jgi:hypothetical protein
MSFLGVPERMPMCFTLYIVSLMCLSQKIFPIEITHELSSPVRVGRTEGGIAHAGLYPHTRWKKAAAQKSSATFSASTT